MGKKKCHINRIKQKQKQKQVIIAEASPSLEGHKLALSLSKLHSTGGNISVTLIPDSNIYAIMSRVNKVS